MSVGMASKSLRLSHDGKEEVTITVIVSFDYDRRCTGMETEQSRHV